MNSNAVCISCKSTNYEILGKNSFFGEKHDAVKCTTCGLVFIHPHPTESELLEYYKKEYRKTVETYEGTPYSKDYKFAQRAVNQGDYIKRFIKPDTPRTALEIGGGKGFLSKGLKNRGFECWLVEPDLNSARYAENSGITVFNGVYSESDLPENYFGLVSMSHSLEHMAEPKSALIDVGKNLASGGVLFVEVPNHIHTNINKTHLSSPHTYYFKPDNLRALVESAGFKIISLDVYGMIFPIRLSLLFMNPARSMRSDADIEKIRSKAFSRTFLKSIYHAMDRIYFTLFGKWERYHEPTDYNKGENIRLIAKIND